jgi:squalene-hopene/tetraprenyl-beta-curcumene cyclase
VETWFTGTGFPRVFYLRYHLYRLYFPIMALGRYLQAHGETADAGYARVGHRGAAPVIELPPRRGPAPAVARAKELVSENT